MANLFAKKSFLTYLSNHKICVGQFSSCLGYKNGNFSMEFFYGIFQMFIWRSTVHLREPVAENRLLPYLLLTKLGGECSHLFLVRNDQNSPNLAWLYSKRWFLPLAPPNEGCSPKGTFEKAHRKWPFLHHKHEMNWPTNYKI